MLSVVSSLFPKPKGQGEVGKATYLNLVLQSRKVGLYGQITGPTRPKSNFTHCSSPRAPDQLISSVSNNRLPSPLLMSLDPVKLNKRLYSQSPLHSSGRVAKILSAIGRSWELKRGANLV